MPQVLKAAGSRLSLLELSKLGLDRASGPEPDGIAELRLCALLSGRTPQTNHARLARSSSLSAIDAAWQLTPTQRAAFMNSRAVTPSHDGAPPVSPRTREATPQKSRAGGPPLTPRRAQEYPVAAAAPVSAPTSPSRASLPIERMPLAPTSPPRTPLRSRRSRAVPTCLGWRGTCEAASVVGSFNGWTERIPLEESRADEWSVVLNLEPGEYVYQFVVVEAGGHVRVACAPGLPMAVTDNGERANVTRVLDQRAEEADAGAAFADSDDDSDGYTQEVPDEVLDILMVSEPPPPPRFLAADLGEIYSQQSSDGARPSPFGAQKAPPIQASLNSALCHVWWGDEYDADDDEVMDDGEAAAPFPDAPVGEANGGVGGIVSGNLAKFWASIGMSPTAPPVDRAPPPPKQPLPPAASGVRRASSSPQPEEMRTTLRYRSKLVTVTLVKPPRATPGDGALCAT